MEHLLLHIQLKLQILNFELQSRKVDFSMNYLALAEQKRNQLDADFKKFSKKEQDFIIRTFSDLQKFDDKKNNKMVSK